MRILSTKEIYRIRHKKIDVTANNMHFRALPSWVEGMEATHIDALLSTKDIMDHAYGYFPKGDSYVFHRKDAHNYFCISRSYLLEHFPELTVKLDALNKKNKSVQS